LDPVALLAEGESDTRAARHVKRPWRAAKHPFMVTLLERRLLLQES
jgi:hypothetical protein